jgi:O-acetyl-ADP-ribose deacetylase (regulator of RNase III)
MDERDTHIVIEGKADPLKAQDAVRTVIETASGKKMEFSIILGNIVQADADAIVCPANSFFEYSSRGVQSAIARSAGKDIFAEANQKAVDYVTETGGVPYREKSGEPTTPLGFTIATGAGNMKRPHVIIHVNSVHVDEEKPDGCDEEAVRVCAENTLKEAEKIGNIKSVAFPAIGSGMWGIGFDESLRGTIEGVRNYLTQDPDSKIQKTSYVIDDQATRENARLVRNLLFNKVYPSLRKQ